MSKRKKYSNKKSGSQDDKALKTIVLLTAILNLIKTLIDIIDNLMD